mgnify:CR=1 FL=1
MTEKLFYEDSHMVTFSATVFSCEQSGEVYEVVLDRTAFFPEGGGQYADTGRLDDAKVTDVQEKAGIIYHKTNQPLEIGKTVQGTIDWKNGFRRCSSIPENILYQGLYMRHMVMTMSDFIWEKMQLQWISTAAFLKKN